jgi:hypothetical protein
MENKHVIIDLILFREGGDEYQVTGKIEKDLLKTPVKSFKFEPLTDNPENIIENISDGYFDLDGTKQPLETDLQLKKEMELYSMVLINSGDEEKAEQAVYQFREFFGYREIN